MRILRLDLRRGQGTVDLHPFMSVVQGLDNVQAEEMVSAIRGLVRGSDVGTCGLIELGGELLELRGDGSDQVGPLTTEDVFVSLHDLEGGSDPVVLKAELDQLNRRAMIDAVQLEEARADLDTAAAARVQRLHEALAAFDGTDDPARVDAVREALREVRGLSAVVREIPEDIQAMLGDWERFESARSTAQPKIDALNRRVQELLVEREDAQSALTEANSLAVPVVLSPAEDARLEEFANTAASGKKNKKSRGADEAEAQHLLAKVGQTSYVGYVMYRMAPEPSPESVALVDTARLRLEQTESRLSEARSELQNGDVMQHLNRQLESVKETARQHLGPMLPNDLGAALRQQVVERDNPEWMEAVRRLYEELVAQGVDVPDDLAPQALADWAAHWIDEADLPPGAGGPSRAELLGQLANAEQDLDRHARTMNRMDRLETASLESAERAAEVESQLGAADAPTGTSGERAVARLRPLADRVRVESGSSVPLVVRGEFSDMDGAALRELLDELEVLAQDLQLVIICDRSEAVEWTSDVGLRRALGSTISSTSV